MVIITKTIVVLAVTTHGCYGQNNKCCGIDTSCCVLNNSSYGFASIYVALNHSCYGFDSSFNVSTRVSVTVTTHAEGGQQLLWDLITVAVKLTFLCASLTCAINLYIFSEVRCVLCVCVCVRTRICWYMLVCAHACMCVFVVPCVHVCRYMWCLCFCVCVLAKSKKLITNNCRAYWMHY